MSESIPTPETDAAELESNIGVTSFDASNLVEAYDFARSLERRAVIAEAALAEKSKWYAELLEVIYADFPDGMNERPDPRQLVKMWRDRFDRAVIAERKLAKAVEALHFIADWPSNADAYNTANSALAALDQIGKEGSQ